MALIGEPGGGINSGPAMISPREILEARARLSDSPEDLQRRTIVRFDACTDPRLVEWIEANGMSLSQEARAFFYDNRPKIKVDILRCAYELFTCVPLDRARMLAAGLRYGVEVHVEGRAKLLLEKTGLSLKKLIRRLARHMHAVFQAHGRTTHPAKALRQIDEMFAGFASGALRIDDGQGEWMNAEPDSAYFFAFAEFCIQAAHFRASPGRTWWIKLGALFAALQDVYCQRYHKPGAGRRFSEYDDDWFDDSIPISVPLLRKQIDSVRRRDTTIRDLMDRVTWNAYWYFIGDMG